MVQHFSDWNFGFGFCSLGGMFFYSFLFYLYIYNNEKKKNVKEEEERRDKVRCDVGYQRHGSSWLLEFWAWVCSEGL